MWGGVELYGLLRVSKWGVLSGDDGGGFGDVRVSPNVTEFGSTRASCQSLCRTLP